MRSQICSSIYCGRPLFPVPCFFVHGAVSNPIETFKHASFGITLATALAMMPQDRHLDCVELWAGVATISRAASQEGMEAVAMDITRIPGKQIGKGLEQRTFCSKTAS